MVVHFQFGWAFRHFSGQFPTLSLSPAFSVKSNVSNPYCSVHQSHLHPIRESTDSRRSFFGVERLDQ
jgi:hypothetical protein